MKLLRYKFMVSLLVGLGLVLGSCGVKEPGAGDIVARVGDRYLLRELVLQLIPDNLSGAEREYFIKQVVEEWVDSHTYAAAAKAEGLSLTPRDQWQVDKFKSELLANRYLNQKIREDEPITDQEIEDYYNANPTQFRRVHDEVDLIHLYFEQLDKTIVSEIRAAKDLMEVIKKNYLDLQITRAVEPNGDLGYLPVQSLKSEFQKAIRGTKTGIIYGPIRTKAGYHYLEVIDRQPAGSLRRLSHVSKNIKEILQAGKRNQRIKGLQDQIRKDYQAETFYKNIL